MSKRIGLVVLAALCALAFSAVVASGASAAGSTAFTCREVTPNTGSFGTEDCTVPGSGTGFNWSDFEIAENETTQLTLKPWEGVSKLETTIAGGHVVLTAKNLECVGCHFTNHKDESGHMDATGSGGHIRYTEVTINTPSCKVVGEEVNTEPLQFTTFNNAGTLGAEITPVTGETEAIVHLENNGTPCALGTEIVVKGHADGTASGAMGIFNTGANELKVGKQEAKLIGEVTLSGGPTGAEHHPVLLTPTAL
jgi:hypothetical protein